MKRMIASLIAVALMLSIVTASAFSNEDKSALSLNLLLVKFFEQEDTDTLFDLDGSRAFVDDDGDVVLYLEADSDYLFTFDPPAARDLINMIWGVFNDFHVQYSSRPFYLSLNYRDEILMHTGGFVLIDQLNGGIYPVLNNQ